MESDNFDFTAISRNEKLATLPSSGIVEKGDYASIDFPETAPKGQEVAILTFALHTSPEMQTAFINGAAKVCVSWILPNAFGLNLGNTEL